MRSILLFTFTCVLFLSTTLVFGQSEAIEAADNNRFFDNEEQKKSAALLRFLNFDTQSETNETAIPDDDEVWEEWEENEDDVPLPPPVTTTKKETTTEKHGYPNSTIAALDTLIPYWVRITAPDYVPFDDRMSFKDSVIANSMFLPFIFDGKVLPDNYQLYDPEFLKKPDAVNEAFLEKNKPKDDIFEANRAKTTINHNLRNHVTANHINLVKRSASSMPTDIPVAKEIRRTSAPARLNIEDTAPVADGSPEQYTHKIKHFITTGNSSLQFSQNYISPNWSAGGNSSLNLVARNDYKFDYDNRKKLKINNALYSEQLLTNGLGDTLRSIKIGKDIFRFNTLLGIKAAKRWYYTLSGEFTTQFFKNYQLNTNDLRSAFLAPFTVNAGLGMQYNYAKQFVDNKYKNINLTANIAPASIKYKKTNDPGIDLAANGFPVKVDKNGTAIVDADTEKPLYETSYYDIGSALDATMTFDVSRYIQWISKFHLFTNYKDVDTYFENTFDFKVTRYLSTRIYLNLVYDSKVPPMEKPEDPNEKYSKYRIQINELLSFGFYYNW